jgi:hypothetical protein
MNSPIFNLHSASSDRELEFSSPGSDGFTVRLKGSGITAALNVSTYTDPLGLVNYFHLLSTHYRPWVGALDWQSFEGDMLISTSCTSLGEVLFQIQLLGLAGAPEEWKLNFGLTSELGQLTRLASQAKQFLSGVSA